MQQAAQLDALPRPADRGVGPETALLAVGDGSDVGWVFDPQGQDVGVRAQRRWRDDDFERVVAALVVDSRPFSQTVHQVVHGAEPDDHLLARPMVGHRDARRYQTHRRTGAGSGRRPATVAAPETGGRTGRRSRAGPALAGGVGIDARLPDAVEGEVRSRMDGDCSRRTSEPARRSYAESAVLKRSRTAHSIIS